MIEAAIPTTPSFAKRVRRARLEEGLDQRGLAARLEVSLNTVSRWESGKSLPRVEHLQQLARVTHRPIAYFTDALPDDEL